VRNRYRVGARYGKSEPFGIGEERGVLLSRSSYPYLLVKPVLQNFLQEKAGKATKQKEEKRKKPKPEVQEAGVPQRQHCPPAKRRGDRNP
jgi:hypothetical protein